jgi:hypothetical protein
LYQNQQYVTTVVTEFFSPQHFDNCPAKVARQRAPSLDDHCQSRFYFPILIQAENLSARLLASLSAQKPLKTLDLQKHRPKIPDLRAASS